MKEKEKTMYKVYVFEVVDFNAVRTCFNREDRPHINDYVAYFAPKLSTCYSIQFLQLQTNGKYKVIESWFKGKYGWKRQ